jgi:predicted O-methyltransferase YrrM
MPEKHVDPRRILQHLLKENPSFHGRKNAGAHNYSLDPLVLEWMANNIKEGSTTLETGCGYSTVVLASLACRHTAISPFAEEHRLIDDWCKRQGLPTEQLRFIAQPSQEVVGGLDCRNLDFVLIDGDHAFPVPFIDWYYTADKIREGGYVVVDDTQIATGAILRDFLARDSARWRPVTEIGRTAVFARATQAPVIAGVFWWQQPFCQVPWNPQPTAPPTKKKWWRRGSSAFG